MTSPQNPGIVIAARDALVEDARQHLRRESLQNVEAFVDWMFGQDYVDEKYYEVVTRRLYPITKEPQK